LDEYYPPGERDRLISPPFNLSGMSSAVLEFEHAYAKRHPKDPDSLIVYVSTACSDNWTKVYANAEDGSGNFATHERTPNFWPQSLDDWCDNGWGAACINIDLSPWIAQPQIRVAFESYNEYGNAMFIDNISISQFVGINESNNSNSITVYPNPSKGVFHIQLNDNHQFNSYKLYNQYGQIVKDDVIDNNKKSFNVGSSQLTDGIYYLHLKGNNTTELKKLIVL